MVEIYIFILIMGIFILILTIARHGKVESEKASFPYSLDIVFDAVVAVLEKLNYGIKRIDRPLGQIRVKSGVIGGGDIIINVEKLDGSTTVVHATCQEVGWYPRKRIEKFFNELEEHLSKTQVIPPSPLK